MNPTRRAVLDPYSRPDMALQPPKLINRLDPRCRVLSAFLTALVILSLSGLPALGAGLLLSLCLLFLVRLPVKQTLKRMVMMDGFIFIMLIMLPFTRPGETAFTLFGLAGSWEGLIQGAQIALKANAIVLMLMTLPGSLEPAVLGHALARLRLPVMLVHLLLFTVRYIDVIHDEYRRLRIAMKMRAFRPRNSLHCWRSYGYLIGMLLVRALERSERILQAMKCRGFTGHFPLLDHFCYQPRDGWFALFLSLACCGLLLLEHGHVF